MDQINQPTQSALPKKRKIFPSLLLVIFFIATFIGGVYLGKNQTHLTVSAPADKDFSLFWDAYNKLHQNYINKDSINEQNIIYGAIAGMTQSLEDPYTAYFDPKQAKLFESDLAGSFDGIGIEVASREGNLTIIAPLKGSPADKAGIRSGDIITKINGKDASKTSSDEAVNIIRGKKGTQITLTIFREGWTSTKDFTITRDTIKIPSITWELKDGNVAYIHMFQFDQTLSPDFTAAAQQILKSPAKKIVLDLRDNPGGYLQTAQEVAGWFLKSGQIVTIEDFGKGITQQEYKTSGNADFSTWPMVILINKGSASASEILAGSLRDNRNIKLIGQQSFGKGSVQDVIELQDGVSFLKITIAKWLTPKGASISEVGLTPDIKVAMPESALTQTPAPDPQLDKALEIVKSLPTAQ